MASSKTCETSDFATRCIRVPAGFTLVKTAEEDAFVDSLLNRITEKTAESAEKSRTIARLEDNISELEEEIVQMEAEKILSDLERDSSHELSYHELLSRFIALEACIGEEKAKNAELEAILHQVLAN